MVARTERRGSRLVILDSHAILHRAYHALPDFSTASGEPTGALYGLVAMLIRLIKDLKPDFIVAARDLPGGTHRHEVYEGYKATRMKADDALITQLEKAPTIFEAFGIPVVAAPGFEADDCIGTIVQQLKGKKDVEIIIATGDLDTLQLVKGDRVRVYTLRQGLNDTVLYDEQKVRERYGFGPEHIVDYKGLRGDPSDNIKGIPGIGEKTATELITKFGSIEEMYRALNKDQDKLREAGIKARMIELLEKGKEDAVFSKELATIRADAPIVFEVPAASWVLADHRVTIQALCDALEFRTLKERIESLGGFSAPASSQEALFSPDETEVEVDPVEFAECSVALWLLHSDTTTPSYEDIVEKTHTRDLEKAREILFGDLKKTGRLWDVFEHIERPLIPLLERMRTVGIALDVKLLRQLSHEYQGELGRLEKQIHEHAGRSFNINSPKQLGDVLFDELKLALPRQKKTATGARTTREEELQKMSDQHPIIEQVLQYRELQKLLSTYVDKLIEIVGEDGRLHAQFLQAGTTTGRMASQDPNIQNIPIRTEYGKRIREAFVAREGRGLAAIDYSQIELRIAAGLSGDKKLIEVFQTGGDIHTAVAASVFRVEPERVDKEMRRRAKVINFGILYGMGVNALRQTLGSDVSRDEASAFLEAYLTSYPELTAYLEKTKAEAAARGFTETLFGRRRYFPGFRSSLPNIQAQAARMAVNAPIQGTQSDIIKMAMVRADSLFRERGWEKDVDLLLQVHDELVYEVDVAQSALIVPVIKEVMEQVVAPSMLNGVPIVAEASTGPNWGTMKRI